MRKPTKPLTKYLRPTQAAELICKSYPSFYRIAKSDPTFPRPYKLSGRTSVYDIDELIAWRDAQPDARGVRQKSLLNLAQRCADFSLGENAAHPFVRGYLLAGGTLRELASETDLPEDGLAVLVEPDGNRELDEDSLKAIYVQAVAQVLRREKELRRRVEENPAATDDPDFSKALFDLDEAHRLTFGRTLMEYLLREGREDGTA